MKQRVTADGRVIDPGWVNVQMEYARWWFECGDLDMAYQNSDGFRDSEDLGDFAEAMITMRGFGPNPRGFDPPITPEDVAEYFKEVEGEDVRGDDQVPVRGEGSGGRLSSDAPHVWRSPITRFED